MDFSKRRSVKSGGKGFSALDFSGLSKVPETFKLVKGSNKIEILPYEASSKMHPLVLSGALKKGDPDYNIILYIHDFVGPSKAKFICPNKNYNKPCPICEASAAAKESGDQETADKLFPKRKVYYNVVDIMNRDKGVQIFESNVKYFQKPLESADADALVEKDAQEALAEDERDDVYVGYTFFADTGKGGRTVKISGSEETFGGNKFIQASNISFLKRKESVTPLLADVIPLDTCIKLASYEEIEAAFMGEDATEEEDEEAPVKKPAKAPVEEDDDEDAPPVKKPAKKAVVEDDEEDEAPPAKAPKAKADDDFTCGSGHTFGKDNGLFDDDCDACPIARYRNCAKASRA